MKSDKMIGDADKAAESADKKSSKMAGEKNEDAKNAKKAKMSGK